MKLKRKLFFKIHSWIGIRLSILFFIVCFSGTLATLSHEMDWLFIPEIRAYGHSGEEVPRGLIAENFKKHHPQGTITFWLRTEEPYLCDIIYKKENGQRSYVLANPYTGEIQGEVRLTFQRFFRDLHYFLFIPFQIGHFTVLLFGFLLLIALLTALVFYKKWWKKLFVLQTGKGALVFFRSLHRLIGVWSVPFTLIFSLTGIWYFLERTNTAGISTVANPKLPEIPLPASSTPSVTFKTSDIDYDRAVAVARQRIPNLKVMDILPPKSADKPIYLTGTSEVPLVRPRSNRVYLDPISYKPIKVQRATEINTTVWLNDIADPLHFGYWGGIASKIIWFFFGLGISGLVLSGIWITAKRKAIKRVQEQKKLMGPWWHINWGLYALSLFFMYYQLVVRYQASVSALMLISTGWAIFILGTWYLFVYRLKKVIPASSKKPKSDSERPL
ncbi:MAG: PepSY-associated TM helix domain-containing protein [Bacteroidota bacterium]